MERTSKDDNLCEDYREFIGDLIFDVYDEVMIQIEDGVEDEHVQKSVYEIGLT